MARILVIKEENQLRLFCNTSDTWVTEILSESKMIKHLMVRKHEEQTFEEAFERVNRCIESDYTKDHLDFLNEFYTYEKCNEMNKKHS